MLNKVALVTGANAGLGLATARALARRTFDLILVCRNAQKAEAVRGPLADENPAIRVDVVVADLANDNSLRRAAEYVNSHYDRLDVLINNAGYTPGKLEFAEDGLEKSFYASHIGHFRLTHYLLPLLKKTAAETGDVRIISLSSAAHAFGSKSRLFRHIDNLSLFAAYGDDKLANLLFAREAARQFTGTGIRAYSVHPGAVRTNFGSDTPGFLGTLIKLAGPLMRTPEQGAQTTVFLATAPLGAIGEENNGAYFADSRVKSPSNRDVTDANAEWLWQKSMEYV